MGWKGRITTFLLCLPVLLHGSSHPTRSASPPARKSDLPHRSLRNEVTPSFEKVDGQSFTLNFLDTSATKHATLSFHRVSAMAEHIDVHWREQDLQAPVECTDDLAFLLSSIFQSDPDTAFLIVQCDDGADQKLVSKTAEDLWRDLVDCRLNHRTLQLVREQSSNVQSTFVRPGRFTTGNNLAARDDVLNRGSAGIEDGGREVEQSEEEVDVGEGEKKGISAGILQGDAKDGQSKVRVEKNRENEPADEVWDDGEEGQMEVDEEELEAADDADAEDEEELEEAEGTEEAEEEEEEKEDEEAQAEDEMTEAEDAQDEEEGDEGRPVKLRISHMQEPRWEDFAFALDGSEGRLTATWLRARSTFSIGLRASSGLSTQRVSLAPSPCVCLGLWPESLSLARSERLSCMLVSVSVPLSWSLSLSFKLSLAPR
eukprot:602794-Rhodomonas_salina.2